MSNHKNINLLATSVLYLCVRFVADFLYNDTPIIFIRHKIETLKHSLQNDEINIGVKT